MTLVVSFLPFKSNISWQTLGLNKKDMLLSLPISLGVIKLVPSAVPSHCQVSQCFPILCERNKPQIGYNKLSHPWMLRKPHGWNSSQDWSSWGDWPPVPDAVTRASSGPLCDAPRWPGSMGSTDQLVGPEHLSLLAQKICSASLL